MENIYTFSNLSKYRDCQHLVTQKNASQAYEFSLALHTNENPIDILENRSLLQQNFPQMKFVVANQTHSDNIAVIDREVTLGWDALETAVENCDALITNQKGVMLTVLTADCVPILLFDPIQNVVATVHAGWKGTQQAIVYKTIKKMETMFACEAKDMLAAVAPSIGVCCYEVGDEVIQYFLNDKQAYIEKENGKYMLNLPYINIRQLLEVGLEEKNIEASEVCTSCEVESYFSYRKEQGCSGRFMSMIGLS